MGFMEGKSASQVGQKYRTFSSPYTCPLLLSLTLSYFTSALSTLSDSLAVAPLHD